MTGYAYAPLQRYVYVALQGEDRIAAYRADKATGRLAKIGDTEARGGPAPMAIDPAREYVYAGLRGVNKLAGFRLDSASGGLRPAGSVDVPSDPCYLSTDRGGRYLMGAYYEAGAVSVHGIGAGGRISAEPAQWIETYRGAHSIQTDPSNRFAFVPHIAGEVGPNRILQYRFDRRTGALTPNDPPELAPEPNAGPRHFCFHPHLDVLYFSNEQACGVTAYRMDSRAGTLTRLQTVSTLPDGYAGANTCAQIQATPDGRFVYAPNRGHDSIACFAAHPDTGLLTRVAIVGTEPVPRAFSLDPEGRFLYAAGLESGNLALYEIDPGTGVPAHVETYRVGRAPMWVLVVDV